MDKKQIEVTINFGGFYNNIHEELIYSLEEHLKDGNEEIEIEFDTKKLLDKYSIALVSFINENFKTNLIFKELYSPKEYNYKTDQIYVLASKKDLKNIVKEISKNYNSELEQNIINDTTFVDGYIPYYTKEEIKKDISLLANSAIEVWLNKFGNEAFFNKQVENSFNDIYEKDMYEIIDDSNDLNL